MTAFLIILGFVTAWIATGGFAYLLWQFYLGFIDDMYEARQLKKLWGIVFAGPLTLIALILSIIVDLIKYLVKKSTLSTTAWQLGYRIRMKFQ